MDDGDLQVEPHPLLSFSACFLAWPFRFVYPSYDTWCRVSPQPHLLSPSFL